MMSTPAWDEAMRPVLDAMDAERPRWVRRRRTARKSWRPACSSSASPGRAPTPRPARAWPETTASATAEALGFDRPRKRVGTGLRLVTSFEGVPSEATVSAPQEPLRPRPARGGVRGAVRGPRQRALRGVPRSLPTRPKLVALGRLALLSHYTSRERTEAQKGRDEGSQTPDAHRRRVHAPHTGQLRQGRARLLHGGGGHADGLPLVTRRVPLATTGEGEAETARDLLENEWRRRRRAPPLRATRSGSWPATAHTAARTCVRLSIERVSCPTPTRSRTAKRDRSVDNAENRRAARLEIRGCENWHLNGLFDLFCKCGKGKTYRRVGKKKSRVFVVDPATGEQREVPEAVARLEGECPQLRTRQPHRWTVADVQQQQGRLQAAAR